MRRTRKGTPNYPIEFRRELAKQACEPGVSVARLALEHGLNTNLLFKWHRAVNEAHAQALLHGEETAVYADAEYQGIEKRCEADAVRWHVAMRPAKRRRLDPGDSLDAIFDQIERLKAGIRATVEHPLRILKRQFGYPKTRYGGLMNNTAQITTLFAWPFMDGS